MTKRSRGDVKPKAKKAGEPVQKGGAFRKGRSSDNPDRIASTQAGKNSHFRSKSKIRLLNMYNEKPDMEARKEKPLEPKRIQPDRRWFGNTRVVTQSKLQTFRDEIGKSVNDPFQVVLKSSKLPMSLLSDNTTGKVARANILACEPFSETFGNKAQRKRPKLSLSNLEALAEAAETRCKDFEETHPDIDKPVEKEAVSADVFNKGTSRRIWRELYKVIDSSDVILEVIDARDPMGTRCLHLERELKKNRPNKYLVLVLNKCDLVPTWVTKKWVAELSKEYPTVAFHAHINKSFGKSALLQLLRQFSSLLKDRKHVSIGFVGYPNVGKSSVINTLKKKNVCKAAPIPGETKVWQYIALSKRMYLIDCPGIVPSDGPQTDAEKLFKGVVRPERVEAPSLYIEHVLQRVKAKYLIKKYSLQDDATWKDADEFLTLVASKQGKLVKGGEADLETTARVVLYDWQKGRLPYFSMPPGGKAPEDANEPDDVPVDVVLDKDDETDLPQDEDAEDNEEISEGQED